MGGWMDLVGDWVRTLVTLVLLMTFVDLLLPKGEMRKYIQTVMGLILIIAMLNPIFRFTQVLDLEEWGAELGLTSSAGVVQRGMEIRSRAEGEVRTQQEEALLGQVKALTRLSGAQVTRAEIGWHEGAVHELRVWIQPEAKRAEVCEILESFYGLDGRVWVGEGG